MSHLQVEGPRKAQAEKMIMSVPRHRVKLLSRHCSAWSHSCRSPGFLCKDENFLGFLLARKSITLRLYPISFAGRCRQSLSLPPPARGERLCDTGYHAAKLRNNSIRAKNLQNYFCLMPVGTCRGASARWKSHRKHGR